MGDATGATRVAGNPFRAGAEAGFSVRGKAAIIACFLTLAGGSLYLAGGRFFTEQPPGGPSVEVVTEQAAIAPSPPPYSRDLYPVWEDLDGDCQDERTEALIRYADDVKMDRCGVDYITFLDPYSGEWYSGWASQLDVDHLVPLAEAHRSGASDWDYDRRSAFANDPFNLVPTAASLNRSKGDKDPSEWMPPDTRIHCAYLVRWKRVKAKWGLEADAAEAAAVAAGLADCPS